VFICIKKCNKKKIKNNLVVVHEALGFVWTTAPHGQAAATAAMLIGAARLLHQVQRVKTPAMMAKVRHVE
jgi:hypothetical protein